MAARVVHFGHDQCLRVDVLTSGGYAVEECGTSAAKLQNSLHEAEVDAVAVTEDGLPAGVDVVAISRAATLAPLILFAGVDKKVDRLQFDVVIPALTHAADWLSIVAQTIENSRAVLAESRRLLNESATLRCESDVTVHNSQAERARANRERLRIQALLKDPSGK